MVPSSSSSTTAVGRSRLPSFRFNYRDRPPVRFVRRITGQLQSSPPTLTPFVCARLSRCLVSTRYPLQPNARPLHSGQSHPFRPYPNGPGQACQVRRTQRAGSSRLLIPPEPPTPHWLAARMLLECTLATPNFYGGATLAYRALCLWNGLERNRQEPQMQYQTHKFL